MFARHTANKFIVVLVPCAIGVYGLVHPDRRNRPGHYNDMVKGYKDVADRLYTDKHHHRPINDEDKSNKDKLPTQKTCEYTVRVKTAKRKSLNVPFIMKVDWLGDKRYIDEEPPCCPDPGTVAAYLLHHKILKKSQVYDDPDDLRYMVSHDRPLLLSYEESMRFWQDECDSITPIPVGHLTLKRPKYYPFYHTHTSKFTHVHTSACTGIW